MFKVSCSELSDFLNNLIVFRPSSQAPTMHTWTEFFDVFQLD